MIDYTGPRLLSLCRHLDGSQSFATDRAAILDRICAGLIAVNPGIIASACT